MRKNQIAATIMTILLASIFSVSSVWASNNQYSLTMQLDKNTYIQGEIVMLSGTIEPVRYSVPLVIEILEPSSAIHLTAKIMPEPDGDNVGHYSYQLALDRDAPTGLWTVNAKYASQYMLYDKESISFRVTDSINVMTSPFLQVSVDGVIDSTSGEWAHKYDSKYWKPYQNDLSKVEGNIAFNAYYINGVLYAVFDVPDKKFDSKDFVEVGIDVNKVGENFSTGDDVYIFRIFRDGTYNSFRLGTEHLGEKSIKHQFSAKAQEGGDIRVQVFNDDGTVEEVFDSLRDKSSTSYKGLLGIAGMEVDSKGNIYVLDSDSGTIGKFSPEGRLLGSFGSIGTEFKEFIDPTGIALDSEGNIFVADTGNARVQKFDEQGKFIGAFGSMGILSVGMAQSAVQKPEENKRHDLFESPEGIVVGQSGNLYVADRRTGAVSIFDNNGNFINSFGLMVNPRGIASDSQGNTYVVEQGNNRIVKFDQNGNVLKTWGTFGIEDGVFKAPYGIAIDSKDNVYVADSVNNRIQKFDTNGNFVSKWGTRGSGLGQFLSPHGLAVDSSDNLYVVDMGNYRIQKFNSDGVFVNQFGSKGSERSSFMSPEAVAIDSQGNIYVTDIYNKKVQKFSNDGTFIAEWGSEGSGSGQFSGPFGITIDKSDSVYVSDPFNRRVQKFDTNGSFVLRWGSSEVKQAPKAEDIPKGDHYLAYDTDSHELVGLVDTNLIKEHGRGAHIIESGQTWKILHIYKDTIYVKPVKYAEDAVLSWTPDGIDVDPYGNVYIVDRENEIAKKFDSEGMLISKWGSTGAADGEFSKPTAMDLDSENNVYIVDTGNSRIQKFDSEGNFIAKWGTTGQGPSQFNNVSTEGIAVDSKGRVYVADLPGEAKATHWIGEVAIPLFLKSDSFGIFLAEGTYGDNMQMNGDQPNSVRIFDVYRNSWPARAISVLPETWANARLVDAEAMKVESGVNMENVRACTKEVCSVLDESKPVLTGTDVIVAASVAVKQTSDEFEYDRMKVTLQYGFDSQKWTDAESKYVLVSEHTPATINLKWTPLDSGDAKLRVVSSGLLTKESVSDVVNIKVQESESFRILADVKWFPNKVMQDEPTTFELAFTGADAGILNNLNYDLRIIKDDRAVVDLPLHSDDGRGVYKYAFKEPGMHVVQVRVVGIGTADDFMPMNKIFNYKVDVKPVNSPVQVSTIQKGESMKLVVKNRDISSLRLNSITLSLVGIDKIDFKLPQSWTSSLDTEANIIQFSTEDEPLRPGEMMEFIVRSKAFAKSLYSACWDIQQSTLVVKLC